MKRSVWGIRKTSYRDLHTYLDQRYNQKMEKIKWLQALLEDEIHKLEHTLDVMSSDDGGTVDGIDIVRDLHVIPEDRYATLFDVSARFTYRWKKRPFGWHTAEASRITSALLEAQQNELDKLHKSLEERMNDRERLLAQLLAIVNSRYASDQRVIDDPGSVQQPSGQEASLWREKLREEVRLELEAEMKRQLDEQVDKQLQRRLQVERQLMKEPKQHMASSKSIATVIPRQTLTNALKPDRQVRLTVNGHGFWETDIEHYLTGNLQLPGLLPSVSELAATSDEPVRYVQVSDPSAISRHSPALAKHAHDLKKKYIVGKLSGVTIKDRSGQLIVDKNEPITERVMVLAEQEGKLAELIIHMIIPGLGDKQ